MHGDIFNALSAGTHPANGGDWQGVQADEEKSGGSAVISEDIYTTPCPMPDEELRRGCTDKIHELEGTDHEQTDRYRQFNS